MHQVAGACHCGNLTFTLATATAPAEILARACDCRFCRIHGAKNWSDPRGSLVIEVGDERLLERYRFALRTADFYLCRRCGTYLAAVLEDGDGCWSTVNLRTTELQVDEAATSYGGEDGSSRIERRKRVWTPTRIVFG